MSALKFERKKERKIYLSIIYRLQKLFPLSNKSKLKIFLNLTWIFDRLSHEYSFKNYDLTVHPVRIKTIEYLRKKIQPNQNVLDLGCDKGEMSFLISHFSKSVLGIDYNKQAIEIAKTNFNRNNLEFRNEEAINYLKSNNEQFDVLILSHIIEHIDNPLEMIQEFKNYFKYIFIEVPDLDNCYLNEYRMKENMNLIYKDDDHIYEFDRESIYELLAKCNVKIIDSEFRYGVQKYWCEV
jgi:SAM-dependent methyltransferase